MQQVLRLVSAGGEAVSAAELVGGAQAARGARDPSRALSLTIRGLRKSFGDNEVLRGMVAKGMGVR